MASIQILYAYYENGPEGLFHNESKKGPQISETEKEAYTKQKVRVLSHCSLFQF